MVGTFWLGSSFKPTPKALLDYFDMNQNEFDEKFNSFADNKRFCMSKRIHNLGSQILSRIRKRAVKDWYHNYGDRLIAITTLIGSDKKGSVFLADNWEKIGETSGLPEKRDAVSMKWNDKSEIDERFVEPDGKNKKDILLTTNLENYDFEVENDEQLSFDEYGL